MKKIIKIILLLALTFSVSIEEIIANEKIKIGLLVPLTGKNSEIGQSIIKSTRLAINKINNLRIFFMNINYLTISFLLAMFFIEPPLLAVIRTI